MSSKVKYTAYPASIEIKENGNIITGYSGPPISDSDPEWVTRGSDEDYWWMMEGIIDATNPRGEIQ